MFTYASAFNQPIDAWNVASVQDIKLTFGDALAFNQNISAWNIGRVYDIEGI
jgi:hypothetical protein